MPRRAPWLLSFALACGHGPEVAIRVSVPGPDSVEVPVPALPVILLPYDRDSVIASLEARAPGPRPHTHALDSLFRAFREPFAAYSVATLRVEKLRDSLGGIKRRLDSLPRNAPEYRPLYLQFAAGSDSLAAATRVRDQRHAALERARQRLGPRIDGLRAGVRLWEATTYRAYDSLTTQLTNAPALRPIADTTGPDGRLRVHRPPGRWWVYARCWDAQDPNREWYWNLPIAADSIVLNSHSGRRRPRY